MKKKTAEERSNEFLQPIVDGAAAMRGSKTQLARLLTARTGAPVSRERVERWLKRDPRKRQQPLLGSGLLLAEAWAKLKNERN